MRGGNDAALAYAADAEAAVIALRGRDHPDAIKAIELNASLLARTNHLAEAEPRYRETLAAERKLYGEDNSYVTKTKIALGRVLLREDRADRRADVPRRRARRVATRPQPTTRMSIRSARWC